MRSSGEFLFRARAQPRAECVFVAVRVFYEVKGAKRRRPTQTNAQVWVFADDCVNYLKGQSAVKWKAQVLTLFYFLRHTAYSEVSGLFRITRSRAGELALLVDFFSPYFIILAAHKFWQLCRRGEAKLRRWLGKHVCHIWVNQSDVLIFKGWQQLHMTTLCRGVVRWGDSHEKKQGAFKF